MSDLYCFNTGCKYHANGNECNLPRDTWYDCPAKITSAADLPQYRMSVDIDGLVRGLEDKVYKNFLDSFIRSAPDKDSKAFKNFIGSMMHNNIPVKVICNVILDMARGDEDGDDS